MSTTTAPAETQPITGEELLALGDIGPCELIDGRIVAMTPPGAEPGKMSFSLSRHLGNFVESRKLGHVLVGETGIYVQRNPDRVRGVERVWIVEPETRSVLVYSSPTAFTQLAAGDTLVGEGALSGFSLPLAELFAQVR